MLNLTKKLIVAEQQGRCFKCLGGRISVVETLY